jgi:hypothetical protein
MYFTQIVHENFVLVLASTKKNAGNFEVTFALQLRLGTTCAIIFRVDCHGSELSASSSQPSIFTLLYFSLARLTFRDFLLHAKSKKGEHIPATGLGGP